MRTSGRVRGGETSPYVLRRLGRARCTMIRRDNQAYRAVNEPTTKADNSLLFDMVELSNKVHYTIRAQAVLLTTPTALLDRAACQNGRSSASKVSGRSRCGECPQSAMTTSR